LEKKHLMFFVFDFINNARLMENICVDVIDAKPVF